MERIMLGLTRRDKIRNVSITIRTGDTVGKILEINWKLAGYLASLRDNRWPKQCWSGNPDKKPVEEEEGDPQYGMLI